ncbi:unnamed protein product, partial [Durusdinium trenchii]
GGCDGTDARRLQQMQQLSFNFVIRIPIQPALADLSSARLQAAIQSMEQASVEQVTQIFNERLQEDTTFQGRVTAEVMSVALASSTTQSSTTQEVVLPHSTRQPMISEDPPTEADLDQMPLFALILTALLVTLCGAMVTYWQITHRLAGSSKEMDRMEKDSFSRMMGVPDDEPPEPDVPVRIPELESMQSSVHDSTSEVEDVHPSETPEPMPEHEPIEVTAQAQVSEPAQLEVDLFAQLEEYDGAPKTYALPQADFSMPKVMDDTPQIAQNCVGQSCEHAGCRPARGSTQRPAA